MENLSLVQYLLMWSVFSLVAAVSAFTGSAIMGIEFEQLGFKRIRPYLYLPLIAFGVVLLGNGSEWASHRKDINGVDYTFTARGKNLTVFTNHKFSVINKNDISTLERKTQVAEVQCQWNQSVKECIELFAENEQKLLSRYSQEKIILSSIK